MLTVSMLAGTLDLDLGRGSGAVLGGSCLAASQLQLLSRDEGAEVGEGLSMSEVVDVRELDEADEVTEAIEVGRLASKTNLAAVPVGIGLIRTGDRVLRKSR